MTHEEEINHPYTLHKRCPCQIDEEAVKTATGIFTASSGVATFVREMERQRVIGKRIWFDEEGNTIFIAKVYACDSGGGCPENKTPIGERCHCDYYNHLTETKPKHYCKCGAEFYRPMFAPIFGEDVSIEPYKTVLSGNDECVLAVRIDKKEE